MLQSPLLMVMHEPVLHRFISYLAEKKAEQEAKPGSHVTIELSREHMAQVRASFRQNILDGERSLHLLSHLLSILLLEEDFELHSNVIGVLPGDDERDRPFLIRERITQDMLFSVTDIDLGNHMLDNFRYRKNLDWVPLHLSANFIEYLPVVHGASGVNRLTSRVKAEEELWNKVTDEIFVLDELVSRDKQLRHYSKYVKDIFGIKIVCEDEARCAAVHEQLKQMTVIGADWEKLGALQGFGVLSNGSANGDRLFDFVESKDYLNCSPDEMKKTGWKAIKSVVQWHDRLFEIQVQPLNNYYLELDHMSGPSHSSFKLKRDGLRDQVSELVPLYGFYRDLLKMLFMGSDVSFECANASVVIT